MNFRDNVQNDDIFWKKIIQIFSECGYDWVADLLEEKNVGPHSDDLAMLYYLRTSYEQEKKAGRQKTVIDKCSTLDECRRRYISLKFYLRRIEFDLMDDMVPFYEFIAQYRISIQEIAEVMKRCVWKEHMDKVGKYIQDTYEEVFPDGR